jgi:regulator of protease activity HflC (stomatin/prohibitin superfamily)
LASKFQVPKQHAITKDNVQVGVDGTIFIKITNVKDSCYKVDQPLNSILNLAQVLIFCCTVSCGKHRMPLAAD